MIILCAETTVQGWEQILPAYKLNCALWKGSSYLDRTGPIWLPDSFGALNVNAARGNCASMPLALTS